VAGRVAGGADEADLNVAVRGEGLLELRQLQLEVAVGVKGDADGRDVVDGRRGLVHVVHGWADDDPVVAGTAETADNEVDHVVKSGREAEVRRGKRRSISTVAEVAKGLLKLQLPPVGPTKHVSMWVCISGWKRGKMGGILCRRPFWDGEGAASVLHIGVSAQSLTSFKLLGAFNETRLSQSGIALTSPEPASPGNGWAEWILIEVGQQYVGDVVYQTCEMLEEHGSG